MDATRKAVRLSNKELEYLKSAHFLPPSLLQSLHTVTAGRHDDCLLTVSRDVAKEFRSAFTYRLAEAGLGTDYEPNAEGMMLEELIDRFHLR